MVAKEFVKFCKEKIAEYYENYNELSEGKKITKDDVYMVWYCKALQNHKALLSTPASDGMYFEMTMNGDKKEVYMDAYKKQFNAVIKLEEE